MRCAEYDQLWEQYMGLRLKHRHCVLLSEDGNCSAAQLLHAYEEKESARRRLADHRGRVRAGRAAAAAASGSGR
jgi:hypothetical protein